MHMMVHDVNGNAAYGYLDDIDAQPEIQMVHFVCEPKDCQKPRLVLCRKIILVRRDGHHLRERKQY